VKRPSLEEFDELIQRWDDVMVSGVGVEEDDRDLRSCRLLQCCSNAGHQVFVAFEVSAPKKLVEAVFGFFVEGVGQNLRFALKDGGYQPDLEVGLNHFLALGLVWVFRFFLSFSLSTK